MHALKFFQESIRNIKSVGTITQSSKHLISGMLRNINFKDSKLIVELGAGDGVITKHILNQMPADSTLLSFEINKSFIGQLKDIDDHRLVVIEDSAEHIGKYVQEHGYQKTDHILSALPLTLMPNNLKYKIVNACCDHMKTGGSYVQMHYSLSQRRIYKNVFGNIDIQFIPLNIPPAFVMVSEKL